MGMCSNIKKSQKNELENSIRPEKPIEEKKTQIPHLNPEEEEFKDMDYWEGEKYTGEGIKRLKGYKCDLLIDQLEALREKFWSKKISRSETWKTIKQACTLDHVRSEMYLKKHNLTPVNGKINELMDTRSRLYIIPNYCINLPYFEKEIHEVDEKHKLKKMSIILYDVYQNKKTNINITDNIQIKDIKLKYSEHNNIDMSKHKLRLLFGGGELKDENFLYQYNFDEGYIIQILKVNV